MEKFIAFFAKARRPKPTVGLAIQGEQLMLCVIDASKQAHFAEIPMSATLTNWRLDAMPCALKHCQLVASLALRNVWYKAIITPHSSHATCYQQVLQVLHESLPMPATSLYFDFHTHALQHVGTRRQLDCVEIIACQREHLHHLKKSLAPLKLAVVDSHAHALHRAFAFCAPTAPNHALFVYLARDFCCLIYHDALPLKHLYHSNPAGAINAWQSRFADLSITHIVIYNPDELTLELPWDVPQSTLCAKRYPHLEALGCALWQGESHA
ncbi:hypothetical protein HPC38_01185 [Pasteurellaceae bacterium HPA106]|uniref:hypothetical protein n=1 Tax=Spirabiliibacterium pneumoniae TaxID=221400 RepID=UPI001AACBE8A|nr:hypothetical protein [Spirabiliibacterium pneumoniae]MBE2895495.1 hypothetical protein [Spirabiliibacterium pneumoniae]